MTDERLDTKWRERDRYSLCSDCPPMEYPTDKTRCWACPLRTNKKASGAPKETEAANELNEREN